MRCCVYTRFVYEVPYIESFIDHYLNLGFDKIILLYHYHQHHKHNHLVLARIDTTKKQVVCLVFSILVLVIRIRSRFHDPHDCFRAGVFRCASRAQE